jgi:phosphate transport system protein
MQANQRPQFQHMLKDLQEDFLELTSMVTKAFQSAIFALKTGNHYQSEQVIQRDKFINARRYELEDSVLNMLTLQQPVVARDLRYVSSMILFASELERMGDYAKGIARISQDMYANGEITDVERRIVLQIEEMSKLALALLQRSVDAFVNRDIQAARQVAREDDTLDALYNEVNLAILTPVFENRAFLDKAMRLNWAAHNIERLGDRVVNICERVVFIETGELADF